MLNRTFNAVPNVYYMYLRLLYNTEAVYAEAVFAYNTATYGGTSASEQAYCILGIAKHRSRCKEIPKECRKAVAQISLNIPFNKYFERDASTAFKTRSFLFALLCANNST